MSEEEHEQLLSGLVEQLNAERESREALPTPPPAAEAPATTRGSRTPRLEDKLESLATPLRCRTPVCGSSSAAGNSDTSNTSATTVKKSILYRGYVLQSLDV